MLISNFFVFLAIMITLYDLKQNKTHTGKKKDEEF